MVEYLFGNLEQRQRGTMSFGCFICSLDPGLNQFEASRAAQFNAHCSVCGKCGQIFRCKGASWSGCWSSSLPRD
ncbi:unnamed protein product [Linum tenue]|uniref:Uncharacterized protein n=1 Tax=Linum tenue TaxID=586396 RepID=A0AAV0NUS7_9ROSI|nr:unnamed protein product [Linum tenue]